MTDETNDATTNLGEVFNPASSHTSLPAAGNTRKIPDLKDDIAKILEKVKIPDRRDSSQTTATENTKKIVPPIPDTQVQTNQSESVGTVHTFKDDLSRVAKEQRMSVVRAASLEEDRKHAKEQAEPPRRIEKKNHLIAFLIGSVLSGITLIAAVIFHQQSNLPAQGIPEYSSLIFSEQSTQLSIDGKDGTDILRDLLSVRSQVANLGSLVNIVPTSGNTPLTGKIFLASLQTQAPDTLLHSLGEKFFVGIHAVDTNAPVMVFTVTSYENAFASMLAWEKTINSDLSPFFTRVPALITRPDSSPERRVFTDEIIKNYDIRTLHEDSGAVVLYYAFPSRNILIIAESPFTFTEVITRLRAQRLL